MASAPKFKVPVLDLGKVAGGPENDQPLMAPREDLREIERKESLESSPIKAERGTEGGEPMHILDSAEDPEPEESEEEEVGGLVTEAEQELSYAAAIHSLEGEKDMSQQLLDELMRQQDVDESGDSLLRGSNIFDNSMARQDVEIVEQIMLRQENNNSDGRDEDLQDPENEEEKEVNVSGLSDLVPEDPGEEEIAAAE